VDEHRDRVPGYQTIRVTAPETPVAALADAEAWQARSAYPEVRFAGGPAFGVAREREEGGWVLHPYFGALFPQDARDSMGSHFRRLAAQAQDAGDQAAHGEWMRAAERMDWEACDEVTVLGARYRVVRADKFLRTGPDGPEPPRPTDPDPGEPGQARQAPDPTGGFVIDPATATGMSEGLLKLELLESARKEGTVPQEVRGDCARAIRTHPGGVLLPAAFTAAERVGGHWQPLGPDTSPTPQAARDSLAMHLRVTIPWELHLGPDQRAGYAAAADQLEESRASELTAAGRQFRVVRIERLVRVGPDGPEGPRPSDPDPQPPVMVQTQHLRGQGHPVEEDENAPIELGEDGKRFLQLFHEEEQRRKARPAKPDTRG
jgi:Family of unknown function (DUF5954)